MLILGDHPLGDGESDRRLADTTRSNDRHQALARKRRDKIRHRVLAANHPSCREWQIVCHRRRACRGQRGPRAFLAPYRSDEIVAPSWHGDDVTMAALTVAEGATQCADLN